MTKAALDHGLACACHSSMSSPPLSRRALLAGAAAFGAASVGGTSSPSSRMLLASSVSRVGSSRYEPRRQLVVLFAVGSVPPTVLSDKIDLAWPTCRLAINGGDDENAVCRRVVSCSRYGAWRRCNSRLASPDKAAGLSDLVGRRLKSRGDREGVHSASERCLSKYGSRHIANGFAVSIDGTQPRNRLVIINQWDSLEQIQTWFQSPEYQKAREVGNKYATFQIIAVEGLPRQ
jgi:uncharacterized protein (DUF1330 family)